MTTELRRPAPGDRLISFLDQSLRLAVGQLSGTRSGARPTPRPPGDTPAAELTRGEARLSAALMRVNHAGEVAAQALYQGQALVARDRTTREHLLAAAREEVDHLDWCAERVRELGSGTSVLNPVWYAGSVMIGALAGLADDRTSLGFVAETERQVEGHIDEHLERLPAGDAPSRAILEQMKADEIRHRQHALAQGGADLPRPVQRLMHLAGRVMTRTAFYV